MYEPLSMIQKSDVAQSEFNVRPMRLRALEIHSTGGHLTSPLL
jgi:hypothetical protein